MADSINFRVQEALRRGDFGEDMGGGFRMKPLGSIAPTPDPNPEVAEPLEPRRPLTRAQRERVPEMMVVQLMQHFMDTLNEPELNPIRDGIPQCRNHPFEQGTARIGCIHSCAKKHPELTLPVVRDYTLGDVMAWVKALVLQGVTQAEIKRGWRQPANLT